MPENRPQGGGVNGVTGHPTSAVDRPAELSSYFNHDSRRHNHVGTWGTPFAIGLEITDHLSIIPSQQPFVHAVHDARVAGAVTDVIDVLRNKAN
jgi:hypothetical protein